MLSSRLIINSLVKKNLPISVIPAATYSDGGFHDERAAIGKREWVCFGKNSQPHYQDNPDFPMPAVRFKEITGELVALREKEKGDWKNLTMEEKKKLYRASFCQTLAEEQAPTGEWKKNLGVTLILISVSLWLYFIQKVFFLKPLPASFSDENRARQLRVMIDMKHGHLSGISSKWDYEKDDWKK